MMQNPSFDDFKGMTYKPRVIHEIYDYVQEDRVKQRGYKDVYLPLSIAAVFDPSTEEITDVGCSIPNDIVNDNFGTLLAKCFRNLDAVRETATLLDITNTSRTVYTYGNHQNTNFIPFNGSFSTAVDNMIQVGSGTTPPTRSDYNVETAFANSGPEDSKQSANDGSYIVNANMIQIAGIIGPTTGGGTVNEICLYGGYPVPPATVTERFFLLSRDAVTITFSAGNSIGVSYIWNV